MKRVLIANRGEIAIRIARTVRAMGMQPVAVYSTADRNADHVFFCQEAREIGGAAPDQSYLNIEKVIQAAKSAGAELVHPGYGFLSERAGFAQACQKAGLIFVGPSPETIELMGDKIRARAVARELKIPGVPGSDGAIADVAEASRVAQQIGYPVLLKAAAGGGGKGMRTVRSEKDLSSSFEAATREATNAFGDGSLYVEKLVENPHHVEVQIFGDGKGNAIHLGERECSVQRRHQKVFEETPAPVMKDASQKEKLLSCAVSLARHLKYAGAGTVEFVTDDRGQFYFLEMNTRLQVEHPVTEWVTGVDLVRWQLELALGRFKFPERLESRGFSMEARIYAEDSQNFLPRPGELGLIVPPSGPFVRWDSSIHYRGEVSVHYDPMIAKLSVWGQTRDEALQRMRVALDELRIEPAKRENGIVRSSLKTNLSFLRRLMRSEKLMAGDTSTGLIASDPSLCDPANPDLSREAVASAIAVDFSKNFASEGSESGPWKQIALQEGVSKWR